MKKILLWGCSLMLIPCLCVGLIWYRLSGGDGDDSSKILDQTEILATAQDFQEEVQLTNVPAFQTAVAATNEAYRSQIFGTPTAPLTTTISVEPTPSPDPMLLLTIEVPTMPAVPTMPGVPTSVP